jgi:anti-anti-sigma factor
VTVPDIEAWLATFDSQPLKVDLSGVTFFDSSALRAFLNIRRRNPNMRVVNPSKAVRKVLELTNTVEYLVESQDLFG